VINSFSGIGEILTRSARSLHCRTVDIKERLTGAGLERVRHEGFSYA
jgi:hypothetical protein